MGNDVVGDQQVSRASLPPQPLGKSIGEELVERVNARLARGGGLLWCRFNTEHLDAAFGEIAQHVPVIACRLDHQAALPKFASFD